MFSQLMSDTVTNTVQISWIPQASQQEPTVYGNSATADSGTKKLHPAQNVTNEDSVYKPQTLTRRDIFRLIKTNQTESRFEPTY